jgi:hypothetical protein
VQSLYLEWNEARTALLDQAWNAYWRIGPRPDGGPAPGGPLVESGGRL